MEFYTNVSKYGNALLYTGYDDNGQRLRQKVPYKPYLLFPSDQGDWRTLHGNNPLRKYRFDSIKACQTFIRENPDQEYHGNTRYTFAFIQERFPAEIVYSKEVIRVLNFDIEIENDGGYSEPAVAANRILSISAKATTDVNYQLFCLDDFDESKSIYKGHVDVHRCNSEEQMLQSFVDYWEMTDPDVITGWYCELFDIPYLINRISRVFGDSALVNRLSPWRIVKQQNVRIMGNEEVKFNIEGVTVLDYIDLFKKFTGHTYGAQESYTLNHISTVVLGEKKIDYKDEGTLNDLYEKDHTKFCDYNIRDVELVSMIDDVLKLIELVYTLAYTAGVNYTDTLGTTTIWDTLIFRRLASDKIAVPVPKHKPRTAFAGGYVKDVQHGLHKWVLSYDLNSLYPNIIIQYNMSPETFTGKILNGINPERILKDGLNAKKYGIPENQCVAANGALFDKSRKGCLPVIVQELYDNRVKLKEKMLEASKKYEETSDHKFKDESTYYKTMQTAIKILMNSLYGALGNAYFRYFDVSIAEAITLTGQLTNQWVTRDINNVLNANFKNNKDWIVAGDTDSIYISLEEIVDRIKPKDPIEFLNEFDRRGLEPTITESFEKLASDLNVYENTMVMKREVIAATAIWVEKKRYLLSVVDSEGVRYKKPKIKIKGIEAIKSSTPMICREMMKSLFEIILNGDMESTQIAIAEFRKKFESSAPEEIAFPRGVSNVTKYFSRETLCIKGTPINSRAAIVYNFMLTQQGLTKKYHLIRNGDKIKFLYLRKSNPTGQNVIGFLTKLPPEFNMNKYIDTDTQFQKAFIDPINIILSKLGWSSEKKNTLEDLFS